MAGAQLMQRMLRDVVTKFTPMHLTPQKPRSLFEHCAHCGGLTSNVCSVCSGIVCGGNVCILAHAEEHRPRG